MASPSGKLISAQLRVGDADLPSHRLEEILAKISAAHQLAGMKRLLFLPSHQPGINKSILEHCHRQGIEVYLWYKVLSDNDIIPENDELVEDAWGTKGAGETGLWSQIFDSEETYLFGCPANAKYNLLVLNKCRQELETHRYDGLFADVIGYPLASLGIEALFTCFCPTCMALDNRMQEWRKNCREFREFIASCTDADLRKIGTFAGMTKRLGIEQWIQFRTTPITRLAARYADLAKEIDLPMGLDVLAPALAKHGGQNFTELGKLADWVKPRIYCHIYGPSSIPLEYYCTAMGLKKWGRRLSMRAIMEFISDSIGLDLPPNAHNLTPVYFTNVAVREQIGKARANIDAPVFPGIECSMHPDYESGLNEKNIHDFLDAAADTEGLVLTWNLLYIPDVFLRLVGEHRKK